MDTRCIFKTKPERRIHSCTKNVSNFYTNVEKCVMQPGHSVKNDNDISHPSIPSNLSCHTQKCTPYDSTTTTTTTILPSSMQWWQQ